MAPIRNAAEGDGLTALHIAAEQGDSQIARLLIGARANVEAKTRLGEYTPLHLAAEGAHVSVVRVLLEAGADVRAATTNTGVTPLHLAAKSAERRRRGSRVAPAWRAGERAGSVGWPDALDVRGRLTGARPQSVSS